jgi:hypothetical protein
VTGEYDREYEIVIKKLMIPGILWLLCVGLVQAQQPPNPPPRVSPLIYGTWQLVGASIAVPVNCRRTVMHISPDGFISEQSHSARGELFSFRAKARIKQEGSRFVLTLGSPQHNGKPDCLGNPAQVITSHFLNSIHLQLSGNRLYHYLGNNEQSGYLRYERLPIAQLDRSTVSRN